MAIAAASVSSSVVSSIVSGIVVSATVSSGCSIASVVVYEVVVSSADVPPQAVNVAATIAVNINFAFFITLPPRKLLFIKTPLSYFNLSSINSLGYPTQIQNCSLVHPAYSFSISSDIKR